MNSDLDLRRDARPAQIDNGALPAGSPMYYYCKSCGHLVAELPEDWWETPPPQLCAYCVGLSADGLLDGKENWINAPVR